MIVFHHLVVMEPLVLMDLVHILASALWGIQDKTVSRKLMNARVHPANMVVHVLTSLVTTSANVQVNCLLNAHPFIWCYCIILSF